MEDRLQIRRKTTYVENKIRGQEDKSAVGQAGDRGQEARRSRRQAV